MRRDGKIPWEVTLKVKAYEKKVKEDAKVSELWNERMQR